MNMIVTAQPAFSGEDLRARREALGISRRTLALEAGCSASMIATIENGYRLLWSRTLPGILAALDRAEQANESEGAPAQDASAKTVEDGDRVPAE